jgi:hypothetical protein
MTTSSWLPSQQKKSTIEGCRAPCQTSSCNLISCSLVWERKTGVFADPLPSTTSGTRLVEEAADFKWDGNSVEAGIGLALTGGGFRAMLFHAGAPQCLNELEPISKLRAAVDPV